MEDSLRDRFAPVMSEAAMALFNELLDAAESVSTDDFGDIVCSFMDPYDEPGELCIMQPLRPVENGSAAHGREWATLQSKLDAHAPPSYRRFLEVCRAMTWGEVGDTGQRILGHGYGVGPGVGGTFHCLGDDAMNEDTFGFAYDPEVFSPIDLDMGDFYFVHPGTGRLCFSTEGVVMEVIDTDDPVEVYLRELRWELITGAEHRSTWLRDWQPN